ncbi:MAG: hypothetical protein JWP12_2980 [Bacteroidetes bacterium]|nr:hypothetical protein [Bacteroidota bacterium]
MEIKNKIISVLTVFLFCVSIAIAQTQDSTETHGIIKIKKKSSGPIYIKASARFFNYEYPANMSMNGNAPQTIQPFPVVEGHAFPFNYSAFFYEKFKGMKIDLRQKETDTVQIYLKVRYNGKVAFKDYSSATNPGMKYANRSAEYQSNDLSLNCMSFLTDIKEWYPAYFILPKKEKFKKQTVIVPYQEKIDCNGIISVIFSTVPFDED